jgi:hypothetical protein
MKTMDRRTKIFLSFTVIIIVVLAASTIDYLRASPVRSIQLKSVPPGSHVMVLPGFSLLYLPKNPHPAQIQTTILPGDGLSAIIEMDYSKGSVTFSKYTCFKRDTREETEIKTNNESGAYRPGLGQIFILGGRDGWPVPSEPGIYEFRIYMGNRIVASAVFEVRMLEPVVTDAPAQGHSYPSREDWIAQHKDSTDPTDVALIKYQQAIEAYRAAHPEVALRSDWGVDYSGELSILTDLGIEGLPGLARQVEPYNPFAVPVIFAIERICNTEFSPVHTFSPEEIASWKNSFDEKMKDYLAN